MRKAILLFSIFILTYCTGSCQTNKPTDAQLRLIYGYSNALPVGTQFAVGLIENGETKFYGIIRQGDSAVYLDNRNAVFEIGSISKVFTSTLLANLALEGKLNLDDNINNYIDWTLNDKAKITFKQLASHTSGLPRMPTNFREVSELSPENPYKYYTEEKLKTYVTEQMYLTKGKKRKYNYSNVGAGLLGYVLTEIEGKPYKSILLEKVLFKYGMTSTTTNRALFDNRLVKGLDANGQEVSNWDLGALVGAGGILSTVEDLSKFAKAQFNPDNRELAMTRERVADASWKMDIGLGWHIINSKSDPFVWHNGGTLGYKSSMAVHAEKKSAVIVLSNASAFNKKSNNIDGLCFDLMKTLINP